MNELSPQMTAEGFLAWPGDGSGRAFPLIGGDVCPMAPASSVHSIIQGELTILIGNARKAAGLSFRIMIHSTRILAELHKRDEAGEWLPEPDDVGACGRLRLASVASDCAIKDAYRGAWLLRPRET